MDALDGNAIGGLLYTVFGTEMTNAMCTCATCGACWRVAESVVFLQAPGTVMRCRSCGAVLMVFVQRDEVNCVDLLGVRTLALAD
jgi:hypothetical protein